MIKYIGNRLLCSVIAILVLELAMASIMAQADDVMDKTKSLSNRSNKSSYDGFCARVSYMRIDNVTCCLHKTMENPIPSFFDLSFKCAESMTKVSADGDDMPTSIYRIYRCFLNESGATSKDLATLENYLKYMTQHYEESVKSTILQYGEKCEAVDSNKDELNRLMDYHNCLVSAETKVCKEPNNKTDAITYDSSSEEFCKRNDSNSDISCCKGKRLPEGVYIRPKSNYNISMNIQCKKSFHYRQKELFNASNNASSNQNITDAYLKSRMMLRRQLELETSKTDLIVDFEAIKTTLFSQFSKSTQRELGNIFDNYMAKKCYILSDNSTVSINEAVKWMESLDERSHFKLYCRLHSYFLYYLQFTILDEYCLGEDWVKNDQDRKYGNNTFSPYSYTFYLPAWW